MSARDDAARRGKEAHVDEVQLRRDLPGEQETERRGDADDEIAPLGEAALALADIPDGDRSHALLPAAAGLAAMPADPRERNNRQSRPGFFLATLPTEPMARTAFMRIRQYLPSRTLAPSPARREPCVRPPGLPNAATGAYSRAGQDGAKAQAQIGPLDARRHPLEPVRAWARRSRHRAHRQGGESR